MTATPVKDGPSTLPPEEKFWRRYSPHSEAPLSVAGSFATHAIGVGGLLLAAVYLASVFVPTPARLPVVPVRVGDGRPARGAPGGDGGPPREDVEAQADLPAELRNEAPRPALEPAQLRQIEQEFDADSTRWFREIPTESANVFAGLQRGIRDQLRANLNGNGAGPGGGGANGPGARPGAAGRKALTDREKRQLRWHMRFTADTGDEYVRQLRGLGAILGFPLGEENQVFHVVRDLRPGAQARVEDVSTFNRIYWYDTKPQAVADVLAALRLDLPGRPVEFVAFLPKALEDRMYDLERRYVVNVLRRPFVEDLILATNFRCVGSPTRGYHAELVSVLMR